MDEITNPHDAFFKYFMSKPQIAVDFLKQHLPEPILAMIDLSTIEEQKESFVDEALRQHFSDLLFRVRTKQGKFVYLYFLFEHKSYPDGNVAFQLLRYFVRIWEAAQARNETILPILGLVVYHGESKWTVARNFASVLEWDKNDPETVQRVQSYVPDFSYHLIDLSSISDDEIIGEVWQRVFALVLKHIYDPTLGEQLYDILKLIVELADKSTGMDMLITVLRYVARAGKGASKDDIRQAVMKLFPKEGATLMKTAAQEWLEEGEAIGIEKGEAIGIEKGEAIGIEKGIEKGKLQTQRKMILQVLQHRFVPTLDTTAIYEQLAKKLEIVTDESTLQKLTNLSLEVFNLSDFVRHFEELLPPSQ